MRANVQRGFDVALDGETVEGIWWDFTMELGLGLGLVAWHFGWCRGGVLTEFRADRIC